MSDLSHLRQVSTSAPGDLIVYTSDEHQVQKVVRADPVILVADELLYQLAFSFAPDDLGVRLAGQLDPREHAWCQYAMAGKHEGHDCIGQFDPRGPMSVPARLPGYWCACFTGCRLLIEPREGDKVVYLIREWDPGRKAWTAAWPD